MPFQPSRRPTRPIEFGGVRIGGDALPSNWLAPGRHGIEGEEDVRALIEARAAGTTRAAGVFLSLIGTDQELSALETSGVPTRKQPFHMPTIIACDAFTAGPRGVYGCVDAVADLILYVPGEEVQGRYEGWAENLCRTASRVRSCGIAFGLIAAPWSLDPRATGGPEEKVATTAAEGARLVELETGKVPLVAVQVENGQSLRKALRLTAERLTANGSQAPLLLFDGYPWRALETEGIGEARVLGPAEIAW